MASPRLRRLRKLARLQREGLVEIEAAVAVEEAEEPQTTLLEEVEDVVEKAAEVIEEAVEAVVKPRPRNKRKKKREE